MEREFALENPPSADPAQSVEARGWRWAWLGSSVGEGGIRRVRLAGAVREAPDLDTLLEPFDRIRHLGAPRRARKVSTGWLRAWVASWPATAWPAVEVTSPIDLPIALLAHQLSPALALARGESPRLLLADAVGRGKTIEAGLLIRELAARAAADRVLVIVPLTLRDQWRAELHSRCRLAADVIDRAALRVRERQVAPDISPFHPPGLALLSIDLAKQPDVLARLVRICWDVLVIDEAHAVSGDSIRGAAAAAIAARARIVLLLTATPHAGETSAFDRLCAIGRLKGEPPLIWFRRSPARGARQRPRHLAIAPGRSAEERASASALGRYVRQLDQTRAPAARLVALVLRKRSLSSPAALAASLRHRMAWLDRRDQNVEQPGLPFDDEETDCGDDVQPGVLRERALTDARAEAALLAAACQAAERATAHWTKLNALRRLLRRTREPVLVFTEYRDTLRALSDTLSAETTVATLHGGLNRGAREGALAQFARGEARVLVATDVAAEGLNLQHACRLVVHTELPWSPARLEQRNGRVDRLGQTRRVHVWHLLGDALHESRVIAALSARVARMHAAGVNVGAMGVPPPALRVEAELDPAHVRPAGNDGATEYTEQLARLRQLVAACTRASGSHSEVGPRSVLPWRRVRPCSGGLPSGVTIVCLRPASARGARPALVPVHVGLTRRPPGSPSRWLPQVAHSAVAAVAAHDCAQPLTDLLRARERALLARAHNDQVSAAARWQGSLFERRTARVVAAARAGVAARIAEHQRRLVELGDGNTCPIPVAVLALLVG